MSPPCESPAPPTASPLLLSACGVMLASLAGKTSCTRYLSAANASVPQSKKVTSAVEDLIGFIIKFIGHCSHGEVHGRGRARVDCCRLALRGVSRLRHCDRVRTHGDPRGAVVSSGVGGRINCGGDLAAGDLHCCA